MGTTVTMATMGTTITTTAVTHTPVMTTTMIVGLTEMQTNVTSVNSIYYHLDNNVNNYCLHASAYSTCQQCQDWYDEYTTGGGITYCNSVTNSPYDASRSKAVMNSGGGTISSRGCYDGYVLSGNCAGSCPV